MLQSHDVVTKFMQVRVKSIKFMEVDAIAIYFYDVTHHFESLKIESEVKEHKHRYAKIANSQSILSFDFRSPLSVSLMFLENLLAS